MADSVDPKWLAEQAHAASDEIIGRYGWFVEPGDDEIDQDTAVRMLVAAGWFQGYEAGLKARHDACDAVNDFLIRWQPSPLPGRLLAYVLVPTSPNVRLVTQTEWAACGFLTFTLEQAQVVHEGWQGSQQGWPDE